ncbi:MAG: helix-turn-helix domain-containing protein [Dehalococcoidia bacterium]
MSEGHLPLRADRPFADELPERLTASGLTLRELARRVGVDVAHLSRTARQADGRRVSGELAARVAVALGLPDDYFAETRQQRVSDAIRADVDLLNSFYEQLPGAGDHRGRKVRPEL